MRRLFTGNSRGEWFVFGQFVLFGLIAFGPRTTARLPEWSPFWRNAGSVAGAVLITVGGCLALAATIELGKNFSPFVRPKEGSILIEKGPYRLVRHPTYSGLLLMGFGWGLWVHGWLTIGYSGMLFFLLNVKARREEKLLEERFAGYSAYRNRVGRFFPRVR